jgi:hypothetical protein
MPLMFDKKVQRNGFDQTTSKTQIDMFPPDTLLFLLEICLERSDVNAFQETLTFADLQKVRTSIQS